MRCCVNPPFLFWLSNRVHKKIPGITPGDFFMRIRGAMTLRCARAGTLPLNRRSRTEVRFPPLLRQSAPPGRPSLSRPTLGAGRAFLLLQAVMIPETRRALRCFAGRLADGSAFISSPVRPPDAEDASLFRSRAGREGARRLGFSAKKDACIARVALCVCRIGLRTSGNDAGIQGT